MVLLFLSQALRLLLRSMTGVTGISGGKSLLWESGSLYNEGTIAAVRAAGENNDDDGSSYSSMSENETAIVFTTRMPIQPVLLERVYEFSKDLAGLRGRGRKYRMAVIVDVTRDRKRPWTLGEYGPMGDIAAYYNRRGSLRLPSEPDVPLPLVFNVTEEILFEEYPKLLNYRNNGPDEKNANDEPGDCCGIPFVWQGFVPIITMFMHHHPQFEYVWRFEDDLGVVGRDSLISLVREWDKDLTGDGSIVDLAGQVVWVNGIPSKNNFIKLRHTASFHSIVMRMGVNYDADKAKDPPDVWMRRHGEWQCYTDAVQRHSRRFSDELHRRISDNTYQFGECFVQPIAWDGNYTRVQLKSLTRRRVGGLERLTGPLAKRTRKQALEEFIKWGKYSTFVYHEEPMKERPQAARLKRVPRRRHRRRLSMLLRDSAANLSSCTK